MSKSLKFLKNGIVGKGVMIMAIIKFSVSDSSLFFVATLCSSLSDCFNMSFDVESNLK